MLQIEYCWRTAPNDGSDWDAKLAYGNSAQAFGCTLDNQAKLCYWRSNPG